MRFFLSGTFRSGTFHSGTFHSGSFRPGSFRPGSFRPDAFPPRHFPPRHFSAPAFCFAAALLSRVFAASGVDVRKREKALVRVGDRSVVMGREVARSEGERDPLGEGRPARQRREGRLVGRNPSGAGRCGRWGRAPGCRDCPAWRISGERVPAGPEWRPDNTNRIKNTRFGLPFNEKFGMFVHMNRIRLAEVTLIGHATGSLSGTCAGRGTGGENIWCFMSPAW